MSIVVGIDTTGYCDRSCAVMGSPTRINAIHEKFDKILKNAGHSGDMHWRRIRKDTRKRIKKPLSIAIKESNLIFFVFDHSRPRGWTKKEFFLKFLPNKYASELEPYFNNLGASEQFIFIKCDNDFDKIMKDGTKQFLFRLLKNLGLRLAGTEISPTIKKDYVVYATLPGGKKLQIIGQLSDRTWKEICIADIVLGLSKENVRLDRVVKKKFV